jgi:cell pole-organizing protein PopZ
MSQTAKAQEPSMEEILASIRRIIADDESKVRAPEPVKAAAPSPRPAVPSPKAVEPAPVRVSAPPPVSAATQEEIDAMLAGFDAAPAADRADDGVADVLDLTESMAAPTQQPPVFRTVESQSDVFFSEEPEPAPRVEERRSAPIPMEASLLSSSTSAAVDSAFNTLAHTVLTQNARTLEDLVKEMMRPMLKSWLDDNLPGLVERVVRAEIERVSRGHG